MPYSSKRRRRKRKRTVSRNSSGPDLTVCRSLDLLVADWKLPANLAHKVVGLCCQTNSRASTKSTTIQVAGSGTVLCGDHAFRSASSVDTAVMRHLGRSAAFEVFSDVALTKKLKTSSRIPLPPIVYVRIDASAQQCEEVLNWFQLDSYDRRQMGRVVGRKLVALESITARRAISTSIVNFTDLSLGSLCGVIPTSIGILRGLTLISIENQRYRGRIPSQIGHLRALRSLTMYDCSLTGPIPTEIGNLYQLEYFDLSANVLTGSLPTEIGRLALLSAINVSGSMGRMQLSGPIPTEVGALSCLEQLWIAHTGLSGCMPTELGLLISLKFVRLSKDHKLTGRCLAQWKERGVCVDLASGSYSDFFSSSSDWDYLDGSDSSGDWICEVNSLSDDDETQ